MNASKDAGVLVAPDTTQAWGVTLYSAGCPACGRVHLVPADRQNIRCPACFAAPLTQQPTRLRAEPPELMVPFRVAPDALGPALEQWARTVWLRPKELAGGVLRARLVPGYVPMWLVDAEAVGGWQAQVGFDYDVASANEHYQDGRWVTQRVTETRIRWEPRAGQVQRAYNNVAVPALDDHNRLLAQLGPYAQEAAGPYQAEVMAAAVVRVPSLEPEAAWPFARARLDDRVAADCQAAASAQHLEQMQLNVDYRGQHWTQLLLPLYATAYQDDDGKWIPVVINGQTGRISGVRRASQKLGWQWTGLLAVVALALFLIGAAISAAGALLPPLLAVGGVLMVLSFVLGLLAPVPAIWAWQHNRAQPV